MTLNHCLAPILVTTHSPLLDQMVLIAQFQNCPKSKYSKSDNHVLDNHHCTRANQPHVSQFQNAAVWANICPYLAQVTWLSIYFRINELSWCCKPDLVVTLIRFEEHNMGCATSADLISHKLGGEVHWRNNEVSMCFYIFLKGKKKA